MTRHTLVALVRASLLATPLTAQDPDSALGERVRRLEIQLEAFRLQHDTPAEIPELSRSRRRVELSGQVIVNGFFNNAKVDNSDVPQFVLPPDPPGGLSASAGGATARQSRLTVTAFESDVLGASFVGELDVDFFGGQIPSSGGRSFPLVRLRRVRADLSWGHVSIMVGQEAPLIAELNPSSLAASGVPGFASAGNLWLWIPQVRLALEAGSAFRIGLEGAALGPTTGTPQGAFATQPSRAEQSRRPFVQGRIRAHWGDPDDPSEIAFGGHYGWIATLADTLLTTRAVAGEVRVLLSRHIEIRGEIFSGEALATLGGGGIGQNLGVNDRPVGVVGGWAQLNIRPTGEWEIGGGIGIDDPDDVDLVPTGARLKNISYEAHLHWRPGPLVFGLEFRRIETTYPPPADVATVNHINVIGGFTL